MKFSKEDTISYVAILAIAISLGSIGIQFTGYATVTDTAVVNVTVSSSAAINFTVSFVDFNSGSVNDGSSGAILDTEGTVTDGTWGATSSGLTLENIGNVNVTLGLKADKVAADYLGGTSPTFKYKVTDASGNTGACVSNAATSYTEFTTSNVTACSPLIFDDATDEIDIDIQLYIPSDSSTGTQTVTITATGTY